MRFSKILKETGFILKRFSLVRPKLNYLKTGGLINSLNTKRSLKEVKKEDKLTCYTVLLKVSSIKSSV